MTVGHDKFPAMDQQTALKLIRDRISVTRQRVAVMKGLVMNQISAVGADRQYTPTIISTIVEGLNTGYAGSSRSGRLNLDPTSDNAVALKQVAEWASFTIAGYEAVWGLIRSGLLLQFGTSEEYSHTVQYFIGRSGSGRSGGLTIPEMNMPVPAAVVRSRCCDLKEVLADSDLYLESLQTPGIHQDIRDALAEAVDCLRNDLYIAAVVMLGRASEGAWIELGLKIASSADVAGKLDGTKKLLDNPDESFARKLRAIMKDYDSKFDMVKPVFDRAGIRLDDFRITYQWAELLRNSRNIVHYKAKSGGDHTYEKVVSLFMTAIPHFRSIYRLYEAAS